MSILAVILAVAATSLHITVWPQGQSEPSKKVYTLRCVPPSGTLPHRKAACTSLMRLARPFAPTPSNTACTEIYGGPQEAFAASSSCLSDSCAITRRFCSTSTSRPPPSHASEAHPCGGRSR